MSLARLHVDPAPRMGAGLRVQADQFAHAKAAAVKQLDHGGIARLQPRAVFFVAEFGQAHRLIDTQGFGQRLAGFGCAHIGHWVAGHQSFAPEPAVKTAPARKHQGDAASAAPGAMHLRNPAAHMAALHLGQLQADLLRMLMQLDQIQRIQLQGAYGQALLDPRMFQVALDQGLAHA